MLLFLFLFRRDANLYLIPQREIHPKGWDREQNKATPFDPWKMSTGQPLHSSLFLYSSRPQPLRSRKYRRFHDNSTVYDKFLGLIMRREDI